MKELNSLQTRAVAGSEGDAEECSIQVGPESFRIRGNDAFTIEDGIYSAWRGTVDATSRIGEESGIFPAINNASNAIGSAYQGVVGTVSGWIEAGSDFINHGH